MKKNNYCCSFCQRGQQLKTQLNRLDQEMKRNRQIREQKESEYEKTVRLFNLNKKEEVS